MKKIILLLGFLLIANCSAFANCEYTCVEPYDMNNKFMSVMSSITGANFLTEKVAQSLLKKEFAKVIKGDDLKVSIDSYSSKDLKNGIFKSASVKGTKLNVEGVYLSSLEMNTLCNFNYVKQKGNGVVFVEDLPMSVALTMSADDINKTMQSDKYKKVIEDLNRLGFGGVKISSTKAEIKSNKFYYTIGVSLPFVKSEKTFSVTADLKVKNGKIDFDNTRLTSKTFNIDLSKIDYIVNYLNPLDFSMKILDNKKANVYIKNINISKNIISADGIAVIPKD